MWRVAYLAAAALLLGPASAARSQPRSEAGERLVIALATAPSGLDPHAFSSGSDSTVHNHVYEALLRVDDRGALEPALAVSWSVVNERIWDIRLRPGVTFHDGTPFTAADVTASFARVLSLKTTLRGLASRLQPITAIEVPDALTLRLHTASPAPVLLRDLSKIVILRASGAAATAPDAFNSGREAIGTGPYRVVSFASDSRLELVRNAAWWDGAVPWRSVALTFIPRDSVRTAALLSGDVDLIERLGPSDAASLAERAGIALSSAQSLAPIYAMFGMGRADGGPFLTAADGASLATNPLRDRRVRHALSLAINRVGLADRLLAGAAVPTGQIAVAGSPDHIAAIAAPVQDLARSRALLAEAGFADGLRIVLHGPSDRYANIAKVAEAVAQMWTRAGVTTTVETLPWIAMARRAGRGEFAALLFGCCPTIPEPLATMREIVVGHDPALANGGSNYGRYANAALDRIVASGLTTFDPLARRHAAEQAATILAEDVPILLLYHPLNIWAARAPVAYTPRLDGLTLAVGARLAR